MTYPDSCTTVALSLVDWHTWQQPWKKKGMGDGNWGGVVDEYGRRQPEDTWKENVSMIYYFVLLWFTRKIKKKIYAKRILWLNFCRKTDFPSGSLRHEKGASPNPKAVSGNSANKLGPMSFGVMPVLLTFMQFWIWVGSPLAASLHTVSLDFSQEGSLTTPSYWGIQVGHCCTWHSETPELGFPYKVQMSLLDLFTLMLCHYWEERQSPEDNLLGCLFFLLAVQSAIVTNWDTDLWV